MTSKQNGLRWKLFSGGRGGALEWWRRTTRWSVWVAPRRPSLALSRTRSPVLQFPCWERVDGNGFVTFGSIPPCAKCTKKKNDEKRNERKEKDDKRQENADKTAAKGKITLAALRGSTRSLSDLSFLDILAPTRKREPTVCPCAYFGVLVRRPEVKPSLVRGGRTKHVDSLRRLVPTKAQSHSPTLLPPPRWASIYKRAKVGSPKERTSSSLRLFRHVKLEKIIKMCENTRHVTR